MGSAKKTKGDEASPLLPWQIGTLSPARFGCHSLPGRYASCRLKEKLNKILPFVFLALFALSRWPDLFPPSFSAAYAVMFCAGVYFAGSMAWWLPLATMIASDVALNFYYQSKGWNVWEMGVLRYQFVNYAACGVLIWLGRRFRRNASFTALLGGGILGALLFFLITNTASWLFNPFGNPEYTKNLWGWLTAIITGTKGWPQTWEFFRNTLLGGGLFTALFVAAMKLTASAESPADKKAGAQEDESEGEAEPEEAKA